MASFFLEHEQATIQFADKIAKQLQPGMRIFLSGELGAGKTTLVRAILGALGYQGRVKSPTYTLVEPYEIAGQQFYHVDLYRVTNTDELEFLGLDQVFADKTICFIEWPEQGGDRLGQADVEINLTHEGSGRNVEIKGLDL